MQFGVTVKMRNWPKINTDDEPQKTCFQRNSNEELNQRNEAIIENQMLIHRTPLLRLHY